MNLNGFLSMTGNVSGSLGADLVVDVEANPSGVATQPLIKLRVGDVIYGIPTGGGGGGSSDYNMLTNKPKINGVILQDELSLHSLGIQEEITFSGEATEYLNGEGAFTTPYIPPDISTNEVETGYKWNGKTVFMKYCESGTIAPETQQASPFLTNIDKYIVIGNRSNIDTDEYSPLCISMYNYQGAGTIYGMVVFNKANHSLYFFNMSKINQITMAALILYTKLS